MNQAEETQKKLELLIRLKKIKDKRLNGEKLTWEDVKEVQKILCWKSFAGCCSPVKGCPWHKAACDVLGIDPSELWECKEQAVNNFILRH